MSLWIVEYYTLQEREDEGAIIEADTAEEAMDLWRQFKGDFFLETEANDAEHWGDCRYDREADVFPFPTEPQPKGVISFTRAGTFKLTPEPKSDVPESVAHAMAQDPAVPESVAHAFGQAEEGS